MISRVRDDSNFLQPGREKDGKGSSSEGEEGPGEEGRGEETRREEAGPSEEEGGLSRHPDSGWAPEPGRSAFGGGILSRRKKAGGEVSPPVFLFGSCVLGPRLVSDAPLDHQLLDLGNCLRWIEPLRAGFRAVQDRVAAVQPERVLERIEPLSCRLVTRIVDPAISLEQRRRSQIAVGVPPVARARRRAAGAQDAFVKPVEPCAIVPRLRPFLGGRR